MRDCANRGAGNRALRYFGNSRRRDAPGRFAYIEVRDNGSGMDDATRDKIFDPFFTTKFQGRGLGLSAVLGIVRRHDGLLRLESAPGAGTTFQVLFPAVDQPALDGQSMPSLRVLDGSGIVLVVDDEEILRNTIRASLEHYGYKVILASDGLEAIELIRNNGAAIRPGADRPCHAGNERDGGVAENTSSSPGLARDSYQRL